MQKILPTLNHEQFRKDLLHLCQKYNEKDSATTLLALASYAVGQLIAMQDQRKVTSAMAMEIVTTNLEAGNAFVIQELEKSKGGNA